MKKLLLLSVLLIVACSSDDSNDNNGDSNQTFLERYDGVIWKEILPSDSDIEWWYIFTQSSFTSCEAYTYGNSYDCDCYSENWGVVDEDGFYSEVIENSPERLVVGQSDWNDDETGLETYTITIETINNGNGIEVHYSDDNSTETYSRETEQPCN